MSLQSRIADVARCQKEIASLESKRAGHANDRAKAMRRAADIQKSITRNTSPSTVEYKMREIQRCQEDAARAATREADVSRQIANEAQKLNRYQEALQKEQTAEARKFQNESRKLQESLSRRQEELERTQRSRLNEIRTAIEPTSDQPGFNQAHDAFISHATEDKEELVRPLATALTDAGFTIWYDEFQLKVGDSLRRSIDKGLRQSRFGIVVLSEAFFKKNWPQYELDGLVAKEMTGGKVILPIWHKISKDQVMHYSPTLADKVALNTSIMTLAEIVDELSSVLKTQKQR